jgi:nucleoside-diphosphate-sugar epimerase
LIRRSPAQDYQIVMSLPPNSRLPQGSTILVTGVTGYIGSWVAHEALALGFKVRGAVRSLEKASWLQEHFDKAFPGQYSQAVLADVSDTTAFKAAISGVSGIAHIAANMGFSADPTPYIPDTIDEILGLLKAAEAEESVKAVVLTSSSLAGVEWGVTGQISKDAYAENTIKQAWDESYEHPAKPFLIYAAAKAQAEKAAWKYVEEVKPHFNLNTILPSCNMGPSLVYENQGHPSTGGWPKALYDGDLSFILNIPPQYFIDVRDTAKLHVGALTDTETPNERLWGFADAYDWNKVLGILRELYPGKKLIDDVDNLGQAEAVLPTESALKVLKDVYGQDGWISLETSLKDAGYDR